MNLTKDQWIEMWEAIKSIEYRKIKCLPTNDRDIVKIKKLIQEVIGKME